MQLSRDSYSRSESVVLLPRRPEVTSFAANEIVRATTLFCGFQNAEVEIVVSFRRRR